MDNKSFRVVFTLKDLTIPGNIIEWHFANPQRIESKVQEIKNLRITIDDQTRFAKVTILLQ